MPNDCYNSINVKGTEKELNDFLDFVNGGKNQEFDFGKFISEKEEKESHKEEWNNFTDEEKKKHGISEKNDDDKFNAWWFNKYGYDWRVANWGTKWNAYYVDINKDNISINDVWITFTTAWSPASSVYYKMIEKFPNLTFNVFYQETGEAFEGEIRGHNGKVILDECYDIQFDECPNCEYSATKRSHKDKFKCEDCGHEFYGQFDIENKVKGKVKEMIGISVNEM